MKQSRRHQKKNPCFLKARRSNPSLVPPIILTEVLSVLEIVEPWLDVIELGLEAVPLVARSSKKRAVSERRAPLAASTASLGAASRIDGREVVADMPYPGKEASTSTGYAKPPFWIFFTEGARR